MHVPRVVPQAGQVVRRAVEDDRAADEDDALHVLLDRAELVRDVHDRDPELAVEVREELRERFLRLGVDTCRRLVEHEERGLRRERLGDECALLHPARQRAKRRIGDRGETDALDRLGDEGSVLTTRAPDDPFPRDAPRGHDFANRRRRVAPGARALREIAERASTRVAVRRLDEEKCRTGRRALEAEQDADERGLPSAVGPRNGDELALAEAQVDVLEHTLPRPVAERDAGELGR